MKQVILLLGALFLSIQLIAQSNPDKLTEADQMPYFAGCDSYDFGSKGKRSCSNDGVISFIANNLVYPTEAKTKEMEGTVFVSFVVEQDGSIADSEILHDIGGGCGEAALAVLAQMPRWEAGQKSGKPVAVKLNLPIHFSLKSTAENLSAKYKLAWGQLRGNTINKDQIKENLNQEIYVRDQFGNTLPISNLTVSFEKKKYFVDAQSKGTINAEQKKLAKKSKVGGILIISATIQDSGNFIDIDREFTVVK